MGYHQRKKKIMICEQCKKEGKVSRVQSMGCSSTLLGYAGYWDEEGNRHSHNPNWINEGYRCSNGHDWSNRYRRPCDCGWPDNENE